MLKKKTLQRRAAGQAFMNTPDPRCAAPIDPATGLPGIAPVPGPLASKF